VPRQEISVAIDRSNGRARGIFYGGALGKPAQLSFDGDVDTAFDELYEKSREQRFVLSSWFAHLLRLQGQQGDHGLVLQEAPAVELSRVAVAWESAPSLNPVPEANGREWNFLSGSAFHGRIARRTFSVMIPSTPWGSFARSTNLYLGGAEQIVPTRK
jgi:hypothetical protein